MSDYQSILLAASELPVADRLRLVDALSASVPDDQPTSLSAEWLSEIDRRSDEIDKSAVQTIAWTDVRRELRRRVGLDGSP